MTAAVPKAFWPVAVVADVNDTLRVQVGASSYTAAIAPATYSSAADLAAAVATALGAAVSNTWSVTVGATGRITIGGASAFSLLLLSGAGATVLARDLLGFGAVDTASGVSATGQYQHQSGWYADDPVQDDTGSLPEFIRAQAAALLGRRKSLHFATRYARTISLAFLSPYKVFKAEEGTGHLNEAIERLYDGGWNRFRWWPDATDEATYEDLVLDLETAKTLPRQRLSPGTALYSLAMKARRAV